MRDLESAAGASPVHAPSFTAGQTCGSVLYYHTDALGSVRNLTNGSGQSTGAYNYKPFGENLSASGSSTNSFQYAGQLNDQQSGLYYLRARYYFPDTGRFITRDPFAGYPNQPQSLNPYAYGYNNPFRYADPSGQCADGDEACWVKLHEIEEKYSNVQIIPSKLWKAQQLELVMKSLDMVLETLEDDMNWFRSALGEVKYVREVKPDGQDANTRYREHPSRVRLGDPVFTGGEERAITTIVHETGHAIDNDKSEHPSDLFAAATSASWTVVLFGKRIPFIGHYKPGCDTVSSYAARDQYEEFAETFAALVVTTSGYESHYNTEGLAQRFKMDVVRGILWGLRP